MIDLVNLNRSAINNMTDIEIINLCTFYKSEPDLSDAEFLITELSNRLTQANDTYHTLKEDLKHLSQRAPKHKESNQLKQE